MAHSTRLNSRELTGMVPEPDRIVRQARPVTNPTSFPAVGPSILVEAVPRSAASRGKEWLSHWLNETRRATVVEEREIQEENPLEKSPYVTEEEVEFVLRWCELKTMIYVAVRNVLTLIDDRIISDLESCTVKSRSTPIRAAVSTAILMVIDGQVREERMSELLKDAASQAVTSQDVISTVARKLIGSDELIGTIVLFLKSTVEKEKRKRKEPVYTHRRRIWQIHRRIWKGNTFQGKLFQSRYSGEG